jgi:hypothetical protein
LQRGGCNIVLYSKKAEDIAKKLQELESGVIVIEVPSLETSLSADAVPFPYNKSVLEAKN